MSRERNRRRTGAPDDQAEPPKSADSATRLDSLTEKQGWGLFMGLLTLIAVIVFAPYLVCQKLYLFKDIGSDTLNALVPRYVHLASYLRESGIPAWSFNVGMGQSLYPHSLGGPFQLLLLIAGPEALPYFLGWMEVLKIAIAGCLVVGWFRVRDHDWLPSVFGGLAYAFCGSMIVGGGWYLFSEIAVYAALVPLGYELFRTRKCHLTFAVVVAAIASFNIFYLAGLGIFGLAYFALRWLATKPDWPSCRREGVVLIGLSVLGVVISAVFSLEEAAEILSHPRMSGEASYAAGLAQTPMFALGDQRFYGTLVMRTLGNDLLGTGSGFQGWYNYLEAPMNYCTLLALLLLPQIFCFVNKRRRVVFAVALGLVIGVQVFPYFRYMFWFFSGDYFRMLSTLISWTYLVLAARALQEILRQRRVNLPLLIGTAALLLIGLYFPWSHGGKPMAVQNGLRTFCLVLIVAEAALIWALATGRNRLAAQVGLLGVLVLELAVVSWLPANKRNVVTAAEWKSEGYNDATKAAIAKIREQDQSFYRIHKYYHSSPAMHASINDALIQDFYGTSSYYSFNQPNYLRFLAGFGLIDMNIEVESRWAPGVRGHHSLEAFCSVKYFLLRTSQQLDAFLRACPEIGTVGDVRILRNSTFIGLGIAYDSVIRESEFAQLPLGHKRLAVLQAALLPDDAATVLPQRTAAELRSLQIPALPTLDISQHSQTSIDGTISVDTPRMLVFSIPLDAGWKATVDGEAVDIQRVAFGLMGVPLTTGEHRVRLSYGPALREEAVALSMLGFAALIGLVVWRRKQDPPTGDGECPDIS